MKIKKVFLAILLGLAILPASVLADVVDVKNESEFKEAILNGNDIKLADNIKITDNIIVDKKIVLDMNEKEITVAYKKFILVMGGDLKVTGTGTLVEEEPYYSPIMLKGSENKSDTNYSTLTIDKDVTVKGWSGAFINQISDSKKFGYGITLNVYGKLVSMVDSTGDKGHGIYVHGNIKDKENCPVINVYKGASITTEGDAIYAAGYAKWNVEGATFYGGDAGFAIKSGVFNIKDTKIKTDGDAKKPIYNNNGIESDGSAFQIESNNSYAGGINITITGGEYESVNNHVIEHYIARKTETEVVESKLESLVVNGGTFKGTIDLMKSDELLINKGTFTDKIGEYVPENYEVVSNSDKTYSVKNIFINEVQNATTKVLVDGKYTNSALEGETITLENTLEDGFYVKSASYKIVGSDTEYRILGNSFIMPKGAITITLDILKYENKEDKAVLLPITPSIDESVDSEIKKELTDATLDNSKTGLLEAIDFDKLEIENANLVEVKLNTTLKSYDEDTKTLIYDIKPTYYVDNDEVGTIPNSAINGKIKIKLPIMSSITDTHVKVIHKSGDTVIDTKNLEIKKDGDQKYVEIETESFSTFELSFYTPTTEVIENPKTLNTLTISIILLIVSSVSFTAISYVFKKRNNL